jgi:leader peptidase (prepilin peptidase) / N-methyltransferase
MGLDLIRPLGAGLVGLVVGSFLATFALRMATGEQAITGRSHCDGCNRRLGALETIPLVSFAATRGACSACGARIDGLHLVGEGIGGLIAFAAFLVLPAGPALLAVLMGWSLLLASLIDWRTFRLPDALTAIVAALALALTALRGTETLAVGLVACGITIVLLLGVRALSARRDMAGLGLGDVKLAGALALWLGWRTPWMGVASAAMATSPMGLVAMALIRPQDGKLPFGPFIALAGFGLGVIQEAGW